jgi:hypothetical protein
MNRHRHIGSGQRSLKVPVDDAARRHLVDVVDEIFIVAEPKGIRAATCDPLRWTSWFAGALFTSYDDRGPLGDRWLVSGSLVGTAEVWLEEHGDGTVVHAYLRVDPTGHHDFRRRQRRRSVTRYALALKQRLFEVKDLLEGDRQPGTTRVPVGERVVSASEPRPTSTTTEGAPPDGRPDDLQHPDRR